MSDKPQRYDWDDWASNDMEWDADTGAPGLTSFGNAVQKWSVMQCRRTSVAEAARTFNCLPSRIVEAIDAHPWMFVEGPDDDFEKLMIEHEGE